MIAEMGGKNAIIIDGDAAVGSLLHLQINDTRSASSPGGKIELFAVAPPLRVMQVQAPRACEGVETYRRTVALVDVSDARDDAGDAMIEIALAAGGRVVFAPDGSLAEWDRIALLSRKEEVR